MVWVNLNLDATVHRDAKVISATKGLPLKDYLAGLIRKGVEEDGS